LNKNDGVGDVVELADVANKIKDQALIFEKQWNDEIDFGS